MEFMVYFSDLNAEAQKKILGQLNTTVEKQNWDLFPIVILELEETVEDED